VVGVGAFQNNSTITSLVIPDSVTLIQDKAFQNNSKLATVSFGSRVTTIGASALDGAGLTAVTIPGTVRSIGNHAFGNNAALTRVRFVGNAPNVGADAFAGAAAGAKAIRAASLTGYGRYGSIWKNLIVTPPGRIAAPTVTASTATFSQDASRITIRGTGFVPGVPSANTVTFDNGAVGSVTVATATSLTVSTERRHRRLCWSGGWCDGHPCREPRRSPEVFERFLGTR
jgi:hypothetical protein